MAVSAATALTSPPGPLLTPNLIYDASKYSTKLKTTKNGVLYQVNAPDTAPLKVMHLYGNAYDRGVAHGQLLSDDLVKFMTTDLEAYFLQECGQIPVDKLPKWLGKAITKLCHDAAPTAFDLALGYVFDQQKKYINASKTNAMEEMQGIAAGICTPVGPNATIPSMCSDKKKLLQKVYNVNMLPELVQMQCSMMGAWGGATPDSKLTQLRTLDFGGGPFADRSILVVHHPTDTSIPFAALSFPAFVGVVTGFSKNIAQSEKVDDVTDGSRPKGSYDGQAVALVIRDMVQLSTTKEDAVAIAQKAKRTWSVWLGIGDTTSNEFIAMLYDQEGATSYNDVTLPKLTNQTSFDSVAYIDKHPQPSTHPDMPALIKQYYGNLSAVNVAQNIPRGMQSGDVHVAVYDFSNKQVYFATGTTDGPTGAYTRLACNSPYLRFDTERLWSEPNPTITTLTMIEGEEDDEPCKTAHADQASCDADKKTGGGCTWCKCGALPSACWTIADSKKLPSSVYQCDSAVADVDIE